ncbi:hypothetical protein B0J14DRAFT_647001 [Halenospora varia]|nr:hypothetical protein B0J14DRAFT_647001 [Halenospora varia]
MTNTLSETSPFLPGPGLERKATIPKNSDSPHRLDREPSPTDFFKRRIRIATIIIAIVSAISIGFWIGAFGVVQYKSFRWTKYSERCIQEVEVCILISLIISTITLFIPIPLIANILLDFICPIVLSIYTARIWQRLNWPNANWCQDRMYYDPEPGPPPPACRYLRVTAKGLMGSGAGLNFFVALLYLYILLMRVVMFSMKTPARTSPKSIR